MAPGSSEKPSHRHSIIDYVKSLVPNFLSLDNQGRIIRPESFPKTIFPGLRLGYFVAALSLRIASYVPRR